MYGGQSSHLPLKINTSGVIPPIFASSILIFPGTIASFFPDNPWAVKAANLLSPQSAVYNLAYIGLIILFCYFYTAVIFNPVAVSAHITKFVGCISGITPAH